MERSGPGSRRVRRAAVVLVAVGVASLGAGRAVAAEQEVVVRDNAFSPKKVKVEVGDIVTWEWRGSNAHNVVVKKGPQKFKSKLQSKGSYERTISKPGTYSIVCTLHSGMSMKIKAKAATTSSSSAPSTTR